MIPPSDHTATPAGFRRNAWLASIGTGGWFASESMVGFVGIRNQRIADEDERPWRLDPASAEALRRTRQWLRRL